MTSFAILLVLTSAGFHVVTHVALKQSRDRSAFVWWMLIWAGVLFLPIPLLGWTTIPPIGWGLMAFSAIFEAGYFGAIALAYRGADLSLVYPLARGTAPVLLMLWSIVFLNESLSLGGVLGILMITVGLYTAIDKVGIGSVPPLLYTYLALWMSVVLLTPWTLRLVGRAGLRAEIKSSRGGTILAGFTTLAAYGVLALKEQGGPMRILGAGFVALGAVMIGFLG